MVTKSKIVHILFNTFGNVKVHAFEILHIHISNYMGNGTVDTYVTVSVFHRSCVKSKAHALAIKAKLRRNYSHMQMPSFAWVRSLSATLDKTFEHWLPIR